jgi:hypothetical protein
VLRLALASVLAWAIGCQGPAESIGAHTFDRGTLKPPPPAAPPPDPAAWGSCPTMHWEAGKTSAAAYAYGGEMLHLRPDGRLIEFGWIVYDPIRDAFSGLKVRSAEPVDCVIQRAYASYTLLADGKTMMVAGGGACDRDDVVQLVDTDSGEMRRVAPMVNARDQHRARLLPNGKVLVMGGSFGEDWSAGSELYSPAEDRWSMVPTPPKFLMDDDGDFRAVSLANGDVLATGSIFDDAGHTYIYSWEQNQWRESAPMPFKYVPASLVLLPDDRVMFVGIGGLTQRDGGKWLHPDERMTFIFDPATETFTKSAPLRRGRSRCGATLLACGDVLVGGGESALWDTPSRGDFELYDPARDRWFDLPAGSPDELHANATLVTLANGDVLAAWGKLDPLPPEATDKEDRPLFLRIDRSH